MKFLLALFAISIASSSFNDVQASLCELTCIVYDGNDFERPLKPESIYGEVSISIEEEFVDSSYNLCDEIRNDNYSDAGDNVKSFIRSENCELD